MSAMAQSTATTREARVEAPTNAVYVLPKPTGSVTIVTAKAPSR